MYSLGKRETIGVDINWLPLDRRQTDISAKAENQSKLNLIFENIHHVIVCKVALTLSLKTWFGKIVELDKVQNIHNYQHCCIKV